MSSLYVSSEQLLQNLISESELTTTNNDILHYTLIKYILQLINMYSIDIYAQYNTILIIITTIIVLSFIRYIFPKNLYNVDWCSLVHAVVTTIGSIVCFYLDTTYYKYTSINSTTIADNNYLSIIEPTRTVVYCAISLSSIHTILPAITLGYSILDIIHGITQGYDFIFHGFITFISVYYMVITCNTPSRMSSMLFMEFSTIFLCYKDTILFNDTIKTINMICFILSFIICRIIVVPYIWYNLLLEISNNYNTNTIYQQCFPSHYYNTILICGILFHCLNGFWLYKIIQKVIRIINGTDNKRSRTTNIDNEQHKEEENKKRN